MGSPGGFGLDTPTRFILPLSESLMNVNCNGASPSWARYPLTASPEKENGKVLVESGVQYLRVPNFLQAGNSTKPRSHLYLPGRDLDQTLRSHSPFAGRELGLKPPSPVGKGKAKCSLFKEPRQLTHFTPTHCTFQAGNSQPKVEVTGAIRFTLAPSKQGTTLSLQVTLASSCQGTSSKHRRYS